MGQRSGGGIETIKRKRGRKWRSRKIEESVRRGERDTEKRKTGEGRQIVKEEEET